MSEVNAVTWKRGVSGTTDTSSRVASDAGGRRRRYELVLSLILAGGLIWLSFNIRPCRSRRGGLLGAALAIKSPRTVGVRLTNASSATARRIPSAGRGR